MLNIVNCDCFHEDIDECFTSNPCRSNQRCINTNGSYKCQNLLSCSGGYASNDEGTQCVGKNATFE